MVDATFLPLFHRSCLGLMLVERHALALRIVIYEAVLPYVLYACCCVGCSIPCHGPACTLQVNHIGALTTNILWQKNCQHNLYIDMGYILLQIFWHFYSHFLDFWCGFKGLFEDGVMHLICINGVRPLFSTQCVLSWHKGGILSRALTSESGKLRRLVERKSGAALRWIEETMYGTGWFSTPLEYGMGKHSGF